MAMSASEAHAVATRLRSTLQNKRRADTRIAAVFVRKSALAGSAIGLGTLRKHGVTPGIKGFPWKPAAWLGLTLVEAFAKNSIVQNIAAGASDATMAVYLENATASGTLVAGDGF